MEWKSGYGPKICKGDGGQVRDLGWRLAGSFDLYGDDGRSAYNSINFITCHDGFTLNDLVSYNSKHNEANLEIIKMVRIRMIHGTAASKERQRILLSSNSESG